VPKKKAKLPLSKTHSKLAKEADGWDPSKFTYGSEKKVSWKCPENHIYEMPIQKRTSRGDGCSYCSGKQVLKGFNDLKSTNPALAKQAFGWDPSTVTSGSGKKLIWKCSLGHYWEATVSHRSKGSGCSVCDGKTVLFGFNDLKSINPELAKEADGWDPSSITSKSGHRKPWICKLGHKWDAAVRHRANGTGCPYCNGQKVLIGFNDLKTTHPKTAVEAFRWDSRTVTANSGTSKKWKCKSGHIWSARVIHRTRGIGCASCASYGFNPDKQAILYLIEHKKMKMLQIGISNSPQSRLPKHLSKGWMIIEVSKKMMGRDALVYETSILQMLKAKGADLSNSKIAGKFDGYSEAWSKSTFPVKSIKELMRLTEEFEEGK
jgi:hypothetical protein